MKLTINISPEVIARLKGLDANVKRDIEGELERAAKAMQASWMPPHVVSAALMLDEWRAKLHMVTGFSSDDVDMLVSLTAEAGQAKGETTIEPNSVWVQSTFESLYGYIMSGGDLNRLRRAIEQYRETLTKRQQELTSGDDSGR